MLKLAYILILFISSVTIGFGQQAPSDPGELHGTVYRRGSGQPLSFASVQLVETNQRLQTNLNGKFRFSNLPPGQYTLIVSSTGYRHPDDSVVVVKSGEHTEVKIYLERIEFLFDEVIVQAQRNTAPVSRESLQGLEIKRIPGTAGDALRALQALPGIGVANDFNSALYIRGGAPEDNLFYFDRLQIGYPYHFGGLVSTLSSAVIERIDVYAGGFGAEFGSDAQAVIDIYSRPGKRERLGGKFNVNPLYSEAILEGPIGKSVSWYAAGRRSYADLLPLPINSDIITALPRFWDYQARISYDLGPKHQLNLNAFAADDFFEFKFGVEDVNNDPSLAGRFYFKNNFDGQGIHLSSTLTDQLTSDFLLSRSYNAFNISFGAGYFLDVKIPIYGIREDLTYGLNQHNQLESGVLLSASPASVSSFFTRPPDEGDASFDFTLAEKVSVDSTNWFNQIEGYLQNRYTPFEFLSIALGLRVDYFNLTNEVSLGPRASIKYKIFGNSEFRFSYGRYEQSPQPYQILPEVGNPNLTPSAALHYILEVERQISAQTSFKVAGYYKDLSALITRDAKQSYLNQGEGYARGVEIFLRHKASDKFFGWVSYANSVSRRRDRPDEPERPYSFDQTHVATLTANYKLTRTWEIGAKWQYSTGNPYTPVTDATRLRLPQTNRIIYVPIYGETNSKRVAPFHRLDIRINKSFIFTRWQIAIYLELLNAYNRKNVLTFDYNNDYSEKDVVYQLPLIPYLGVTVEF